MNKWVSVAISALSDFFFTAGTAYLATGSATSAIPSTAQIVACVIGGIVQAARGVQKTLTPPPQ